MKHYYKNCKIKIFITTIGNEDKVEIEINNFLSDKFLLDIKTSQSTIPNISGNIFESPIVSHQITLTVIYTE
ncbi:MAG: hypothetical protein ACRC0V_06655 [Fusobacteriaceae bacterium]